MAKLNKDILLIIFEELQEDSKALFSSLMVNRIWCETAIPVLWRNPWSYSNINYKNKNYLFIIITCYIYDNIKKFITEQGIQLPSGSNQSLIFDYLSFCRSVNVNAINSIISIGSSLPYNQFSMQKEFYSFIMRKCHELKYLDMSSIKHQIFYFPEAKARIESLCELKCDTSIDFSYFYGLSHFCQSIQRLTVDNTYPKPNHGIVKLIEVQKNLKHFEWKDDFDDDYLTEDPYEEIFIALEKKANSLNYLKVFFQYVEGIENTLIQEILPKLSKLKILIIDDYLYFTDKQLEQLKMMIYNELEVINIEFSRLDVMSNIIENNGRYLKKILFKPYNIMDIDLDLDDDFDTNSLKFICKVYENCPSIEYLSLIFPSTEKHFIEFEKLLKICKNLKSLLIVIFNNEEEDTYEDSLKNGKKLLKILTRSAPTNLKEIRLGDEFKFSLKCFRKFLENWRGRNALSIFTIDSIFITEDYIKLIDEYKSDGVIKDFKYAPYSSGLIYYCA
ncbi:hypothetical protein RclHR1_07450001 [Rhizophagus clarus]|uniref:F-box domain-containing protein n=1 Tax=Rhizophagus clarus TaxID=94130 RepID=A0A2Z6S3A2_9GLOM|nr:hypothetical protein RclHR1_07450001 [Rhizophagus clarus]GES83938.1 hypothetical protein GLOIN_2v1764020 [Rhizophagus clarus]